MNDMQNIPQPAKLHRTGNRSGSLLGGITVASKMCRMIITTYASLGKYPVMYLSEKMSMSVSPSVGSDDGTLAMLLMHRKIAMQQTYASTNRSITSNGQRLHAARIEKKRMKFGVSTINSDIGARGMRMPFSWT